MVNLRPFYRIFQDNLNFIIIVVVIYFACFLQNLNPAYSVILLALYVCISARRMGVRHGFEGDVTPQFSNKKNETKKHRLHESFKIASVSCSLGPLLAKMNIF